MTRRARRVAVLESRVAVLTETLATMAETLGHHFEAHEHCRCEWSNPVPVSELVQIWSRPSG